MKAKYGPKYQYSISPLLHCGMNVTFLECLKHHILCTAHQHYRVKLYSNIIHDDVTKIFSCNIRLSKYDRGKGAFICNVRWPNGHYI